MVVICANTSWYLVNFRSSLVVSLIGAGYQVVAVAPSDRWSPRLEELGCRFVPIVIDNKGVSPSRDLALLGRFWGLLRGLRPIAFLGFTIKPNIYGSLACRALGVATINDISGLGTAFIRENWLTNIVCALYRAALARAHVVFFENPDDRKLFLDRALVQPGRAALLPGAGIDLSWFAPRASTRPAGEPFRFLLIARLLWDKGVGEFIAAARQVRARKPDVEFQIVGMLNVQNRTAVDSASVEAWVAEGLIDYSGALDDVRPAIANCDCVVLPSYREGAPRTLLEAQAMARPVITTDVPGCREVVEADVTGLLCRVRDADDLARAMFRIIEMTDAERRAMGEAGRRMIEARYDEAIVIRAYLDELESAARYCAAITRVE